jgi:hypothetical protein
MQSMVASINWILRASLRASRAMAGFLTRSGVARQSRPGDNPRQLKLNAVSCDVRVGSVARQANPHHRRRHGPRPVDGKTIPGAGREPCHLRPARRGAEAAAAELEQIAPGKVAWQRCDIRDAAAVEAMLDALWADGPLDALVNNAAGNFLAKTRSCRRAPSTRCLASCCMAPPT